MITFQKSIFVNRPVESVFAYATENEYFNRWMPGLLFSKVTSDGTMGLGTNFLQRLQIGTKLEDVMGRIVVFETNRRWAYTGLGETFCFRRSWVFERLSKGTKINYYEELSSRRALPMYFSLILRYKSAKINAQSLEAFRREIESGADLPLANR